MGDLTKREAERIIKENEILKELSLVTPNTYELVEKHTRKMAKKMLQLILQE
jgi:hypothetical protein